MATGLTKRWDRVSLRAKITGVTVFILSLGLLVAAAGTVSFLGPQLIAQQDAKLQQLRIDPTAALAPGADPSKLTRYDVKSAPELHYVAMLDPNGELLYNNYSHKADELDPPLVSPLSEVTIVSESSGIFQLESAQGVEWRAIATPVSASSSGEEPGGYLLIASSAAQTNNFMVHWITVFSGFGIGVILLGAALTRILVTNTFEPLAEVERTAAEIAEGDFSQRIAVAETNTEVGHLGRSLNTMLDRIDESFRDRAQTIEQMRRFVGDASHELRTPLVSVRGYAELYRMGALQSPDQVGQAMERIEKEAIRMTSLVEDLLALARLDERRPMQMAPINLAPLARDAALDTLAQSPERQVSVIVESSAEGPEPEFVRLAAQDALPKRGSQKLSVGHSFALPEEAPAATAAAETAPSPTSASESHTLPSATHTASEADQQDLVNAPPHKPKRTLRALATGRLRVVGKSEGERKNNRSSSVSPVSPASPAIKPAPSDQRKGSLPASAADTPTGALAFGSNALAKFRQHRIKKSSQLDTQPIDQRELQSLLAEHTPAESGVNPGEGIAPVVLGDEHRVRQVMTNLLGNALRYSPEGSPIEIRVATQESDRTASFEIVDHGEGIPEQIRVKIFERFWRADNSRNRETGGSGLGLAIVSSIVAAHQGTVSAHETPGGGATFRVVLPLMNVPEPALQETVSPG